MRLDGRVAFVTGSSRGIGAAIARRLAADGAKIILHASKSAEKANVVADTIRAGGGSADIVLGDLAQGETTTEVVREAFAVHGALDILVCNAGGATFGPAVEMDVAAIDAILALNLRSVILATTEFARLTESENGRVVLISSGAALQPAVNATIYSAAKAGAEAFIRSVAQELGERGITLNSVEPGMTLSREADQAMIDKIAGWTAMRRVGQPEDIADITAFLASDDARWLTGVTLPANGGQVGSATTIFAYDQ